MHESFGLLVLILITVVSSKEFNWRDYNTTTEVKRKSDILVLVQLTDTHINHFKKSKSPNLINDLTHFFNTTLRMINPDIVIHTGDITDGILRTGGSRQHIHEWEDYSQILNGSGILDRAVYLDVRGNHDSFKVTNWNSPSNFYSQFSIRAAAQQSRHPFMHTHRVNNIETGLVTSYNFIGIDAAPEPGPGRPFNFVGRLAKTDRLILEDMIESVDNTSGTIYLSHYPTPYVRCHGRRNIRELLSKIGSYYLCGHLHTISQIVRHMYYRHSSNLVELELGDWKQNRYFRIGVFERGVFTFSDFEMNPTNKVGIVVISPKNPGYMLDREEDEVMNRHSTQPIRLLVFSFDGQCINEVAVTIDDIPLGNASKDKSSPNLYTLSWNTSLYKNGIHRLKVNVSSQNFTTLLKHHEFSFDQKEFTKIKFGSIHSKFFLKSFDLHIGSLILHYAVFLHICSIIFFHYYSSKQIAPNSNFSTSMVYKITSTTRSAWISVTDCLHTFYSVKFCFIASILCTLYYTFGPWAIGEVSDNLYGVVFLWGIFLAGQYTPTDMQYVYGSPHFFILFMPLNLSLAMSVYKRRIQMNNPRLSVSTTPSITETIRPLVTLPNVIFVLFMVMNAMLINTFEVMYPPSLILSPICALNYVYVFGLIWLFFQLAPDWAVERAFKTSENIDPDPELKLS